MNAHAPVLAFEGVDAFYGAAHILHGVSFQVRAGESVAILGRNGVGKTTIVNTLLGIARHGAGAIRFHDRAIERPRPYQAARAGIGVALQGRKLFPNLSVRENLMLGAASNRAGAWTLDGVFDLFPVLRERAEAPGTALSGGQQQMLAIGRALMANPDLLVLDEPSEGLAPVIVDELAAVFGALNAKGTALLLIEQNLSLVERVSRRFAVLAKGRVVEEGSLDGIDRTSLQRHIAI
ncbi:MAG: ABC transporter ATP-binding protein [Rhodospirillales bacterium]|nr:ABC transporter ATP-binding protein [Rhodospirillales bacterium]